MDVLPTIATLLATLIAALLLRNYWALVIGTMAGSLIGLVLSYLIHPFRPRISTRRAGAYFRFSKWVFLNSSLHYLDARFADLLVAKQLGTIDLGIFRMGSNIASFATTELAEPINRVLFPGYSRVAGDPDAFRRSYLQSVSMLVYGALPAALGIVAVADPLVSVLLGAKWSAAAPVVAILALRGALLSLSINDYAVYMAKGRPEIILYLKLPYVSVLLVLLFILTTKYGFIGSAAAFVAADLILMPLFFLVRFRTLGITINDFARAIWRSLCASIVMLVAVTYFIGWSEGRLDSELVVLVVSVIGGFGCYLGITFLLWLAGRPEGTPEALLVRFARNSVMRVVRVAVSG